MRHQPRLIGERIEHVGVGFNRIDRRKPQPRKLRHLAQDAFDQCAEPRLAVAVTGDIDPGKHDFAIAVLGEPPHLRDYILYRQGSRIAAAKGDDAKCTAVVAAVLHLHKSTRAAFNARDRMRPHRLYRHDVSDSDLMLRPPQPSVELLFVAGDAVYFRHCGERFRRGLCRTAGHDNARMRPLAADAADALLGLPHRFGGDGASVHDDTLADARVRPAPPDHLRFVRVQAAAEGDDVDAHGTAVFPKAGSKVPANSNSTGPVISTCSSLSRHSMVSWPPGSVTCTVLSVRLSRAAATAAAQAAEPQPLVRPAPRSQVRMTIASRETIWASVMLARSGKIG